LACVQPHCLVSVFFPFLSAQAMRLTLLLPLLVAFADAQRGYNSYDEMAQAQMMYRQQEQAAKAAQAQRQRELQAQQQAALLQQARQQALYEQHLRADQQNRAGSFPSTPQNSKKPRMSAKDKKAHEKRKKELDAQKKKQLKELDKRRKLARDARPHPSLSLALPLAIPRPRPAAAPLCRQRRRPDAAGAASGACWGGSFRSRAWCCLAGLDTSTWRSDSCSPPSSSSPSRCSSRPCGPSPSSRSSASSSPALAARTAAAAASSRAATEAGPAAGMDADMRISHEGGASGGAARAERSDCPIPRRVS